MCLIAFAWNVHPRLPLVIVANRDEFHERPTAALAAWDGMPGIVGGRDLREGGGWLALDWTRGRLAAVTNVREAQLTGARRSRGALVSGFVGGADCAVSFAEDVRMSGDEFGPFNLIVWDGGDLVYVTNRRKPRWESLRPGIHGLSNGALDDPWPKTRQLCGSLATWLGARAPAESTPLADLDFEPLLLALRDETVPPDGELPQTGVGLARERFVAPAFIRNAEYGTRASTVVLIGRAGDALFVEQRFGPGGSDLGRRQLAL